MEARTALLIAVGAALALPYVTVAVLRSGGLGVAALGLLFTLGIIALVVGSDLRESAEE